MATPSFSTLGLGLQDPFQIFAKLGFVTAVLTIFAIMLSDFFDTMGTVTGVAAEAGLAKEDGSVPGIGRVLIVDSVAAVAGGAGGVSSNTTYIESAAGVADGGRTGFASVVTGVLFLLAIFLSPIAGLIPSQATAPALVLVGYLMFTHRQGHPGRRRRGRPAGAADDDPHAADVRHHGRHRRRVHHLGAAQGRARQGRPRSTR